MHTVPCRVLVQSSSAHAHMRKHTHKDDAAPARQVERIVPQQPPEGSAWRRTKLHDAEDSKYWYASASLRHMSDHIAKGLDGYYNKVLYVTRDMTSLARFRF